MGQACSAIDAICLSPAVAEAASAGAWRAIHVAASPDQPAMIEERNRMQNSKDNDPPAKPGSDKSGDDKSGGDKTTSAQSKIPASTLEKAVARDARDRKSGDGPRGAATDDKKSGEKQSPEKSAAGHGGVGLVGALVLLLILAGAWISWPAWGPTLPGWLQSAVAPVMEAGRGAGTGGRVDALAGRITGLERDIGAVKSDFAARPQVDPGRISAIGETARGNADRLKAMEADIASLRQALSGAGPSEEVASLARRLGEAESRIAALAAEPGTSAAVEAMDVLRTQSSARMTVLERENNALRKLIAMQDERLAALEKRPAAVAGTIRTNALVIAVGQLREAARGTAPFADALEAVTALATEDGPLRTEIATLGPLAATGAPDITALRLQFDRISARIASEAFVPKGESWVDKTLQQLSRLVTVKRSGTEAASRDDENGMVARAELRLAAGDLPGAVAALDGLSSRAAEIAAPWLKQAQARLAVDRAVGKLFAEALRRTGVTGKDSTGG